MISSSFFEFHVKPLSTNYQPPIKPFSAPHVILHAERRNPTSSIYHYGGNTMNAKRNLPQSMVSIILVASLLSTILAAWGPWGFHPMMWANMAHCWEPEEEETEKKNEA
jgi:hypothetical protein